MAVARFVKPEESDLVGGKYMVGITRQFGRKVNGSPWPQRINVTWLYLRPDVFEKEFEIIGPADNGFVEVRQIV